MLLGMLTKDNQIKANIPSGDRSAYSLEHYKFLLEAPFEVSSKCCNTMKKNPAKEYGKKTHRVPITAEMASESRLRTQKWLEHGCNGFDMKTPKSTPMAFWTEQDVLLYIRTHDLKICSVYGDVVTDDEESGQINLSQYTGCELFDVSPTLHCTGCDRTGCCLCGFGAMLEGQANSRFLRLKETHPQMYKMLDVAQNNGYTMRQAMEWCNERMTGRRHFYL